MADDLETVLDALSVMILQEQTHYVCVDYMRHERTSLYNWETIHEQEGVGNEDELEQQRTAALSLCEQVDSSGQNHTLFLDSPRSCCSVVKSLSAIDVREQLYNNNLNISCSMHHSDCIARIQQLHHQVSLKHENSFSFWRHQMFDWACMVVDNFHIDRMIVAVSFNLLDRFINKEINTPGSPPVTRDDYQLFSMVCLYIAGKILESYPQKISMRSLVEMSRNYYTIEVIEATEYEICNSLDWYLHAPTGIGYCRLFVQMLPIEAIERISKEMIETATTLTEIAVSDPTFVAYRPSLVGLAAIIHAARIDGMTAEMISEFCNSIKGLIDIDKNVEFYTIYLQLEKLYCY